MWCLADLDAAYLACMEDVLALYERHYREVGFRCAALTRSSQVVRDSM